MVKSLRERLLARRLLAKGPQSPADQDFSARHPLLFDLLTRPLRVAKRVLEPCRLSVVIGDGDWVVSLNDAVLKQTLAVRSETLAGGFQALEEALKAPDQRWSLWKGKEVRLPRPGGTEKSGKKKVVTEEDEE